MDLFKYYSLDEAYTNRNDIIDKLNQLESLSKINFEIEDNDILFIEDLELDEFEIEELLNFFDKNDVFPYLEREDDDDIGYIDNDFLDFDDDY